MDSGVIPGIGGEYINIALILLHLNTLLQQTIKEREGSLRQTML